MIRVLHIIDHLGPGGAQTALLNLLKFRDGSRFEHTVASMHGRGKTADEFSALGVRVLSLSPSKWPPLYFAGLCSLLRSERFDIAHCHLFGANWLARPLVRLLGCRVIFTHDQCNDAMRDKFVYRFIDRLTNSLATRILAVSRSTVDFLVRREHLPPSQVEYFANGIDVAAFPPASPEVVATARRQWNLPHSATVIGGVGRLVPQKDFFTFLEAAAIVSQNRPDLHFAIFGDGPDEAALKVRAAALGLTDRVTFAGYVDDRVAIYAAIDVMFLTSRYEGTPMVLLEAMAAQVPIAASAVDGTAEILQDGISASLFPPGDAEAAAGALEEILRDSSRAAVQVSAASDTVRDQFDARALMARLERRYFDSISVNTSSKPDIAEKSLADTRDVHS